MNWIYDHSTDHSRMMVGYDRYGILIRMWSESDYESPAYRVEEGFYTWEAFWSRKRYYSGDNGSGRMKDRIVAGAISLMGLWGGSSDNTGEVYSLRDYINGGHTFQC